MSVVPVPTATRSRGLPSAARWAVTLAIGAAIGVATSFAQKHLPGGWNALANAASPWLTGAFVAGALHRRPGAAALAGLVACLAEVAAYYVVTPLRGYAVSTNEIVFWSVCAVIGGPLLGWGGSRWWRSTDRWRAVGAALLPASFLGEAIGAYAIRLHYWGSAALFAGLALAALLVVTVVPAARRGRGPAAVILGWTVALTVLAALLYGPVLEIFGSAAFG